jgi:hypothetical protein
MNSPCLITDFHTFWAKFLNNAWWSLVILLLYTVHIDVHFLLIDLEIWFGFVTWERSYDNAPIEYWLIFFSLIFGLDRPHGSWAKKMFTYGFIDIDIWFGYA